MLQNKKYFGTSSFYRNALAIAIPVMLQVLLQNLISLIDNFMVAGLGDVKMSGVNVANQIIFVFFVALNTLVSAGGIFMSQFNGAKDAEGMRQTFKFKIFSSLALAIGFGAVSLAVPGALLGALVNTNTEAAAIVAEGKTYFFWIVLSFIPIAISFAIGSSLRELGKVRPPLVIAVIAALVNTFFNWVLIYGNLGAPRLEVAGAAIATVIARVFEMVAFIVYIARTKPDFYVRARELLAVNFRIFFAILRKGGIIFLSEMSWVVTETVMTAVYNGRGGAEIVAGMSAAWAIGNLFFMVFNGVHTSVNVIVGSTLGKNELDRARQEARWLRNGSIVAGFSIAAVEAFSVLAIPLVFGNLSDDAQIVTRTMLWVISAYMPIWTYLNAQFATARAGGDAIMGAWVDIGINSTMFLPGILLLAFFTDLGPITIYAIVKLTDPVKVVIAHWQLKKERWVKNLALEHGTQGEVP